MGIEPTWSAWEAEVLPLNYTRAHVWVFAQTYVFYPVMEKMSTANLIFPGIRAFSLFFFALFFQKMRQLSLHALQRVVDGLDMAI